MELLLLLLLLLLGRPNNGCVLLCVILPISCCTAAAMPLLRAPRRSRAGLLHLIWVLPPQGRRRLSVGGRQPRTAPAKTENRSATDKRNTSSSKLFHPRRSESLCCSRLAVPLHFPCAIQVHDPMMLHSKPQQAPHHHQQQHIPAYLGVELSVANSLPAALDALRPRAPTPAAPTPCAPLLPPPAFCLPRVGVRLPAGPAVGGSGKPGKCPGCVV
jgi:hypothetical protein